MLLLLGACTTQPATVAQCETDRLLQLIGQAVEAETVAQQRAVMDTQRAQFEASPDHHNLLALALVRAFTAVLPAELQDVQADLQVLAAARVELSDSQRHLAMLALSMVDERLRLGGQIYQLQRQIDSLTEIEATLKGRSDGNTGEPTP